MQVPGALVKAVAARLAMPASPMAEPPSKRARILVPRICESQNKRLCKWRSREGRTRRRQKTRLLNYTSFLPLITCL